MIKWKDVESILYCGRYPVRWDRIDELMTKKKVSKRQLSRELGYGDTWYWSARRDKSWLYFNAIALLCEKLNVKASYIIRTTENDDV